MSQSQFEGGEAGSSWSQFLLRRRLVRPVLEQLILDRALEPVPCSAAAIEQQAQRLLDEDRTIAQSFTTREQFLLWVERTLKLRRFQQQWERSARSYFLEQKETFDQVIYSLIRINCPATATELYAQICDDGVPFEAIARQFSIGFEQHTGGVVGPQPVADLHPAVKLHLQPQLAGQVSLPLRLSSDTWAIVRLDQWLPAVLDEAMHQRMIELLFGRWLEQEVDAQLATLTPVALDKALEQARL